MPGDPGACDRLAGIFSNISGSVPARGTDRRRRVERLRCSRGHGVAHDVPERVVVSSYVIINTRRAQSPKEIRSTLLLKTCPAVRNRSPRLSIPRRPFAILRLFSSEAPPPVKADIGKPSRADQASFQALDLAESIRARSPSREPRRTRKAGFSTTIAVRRSGVDRPTVSTPALMTWVNRQE